MTSFSRDQMMEAEQGARELVIALEHAGLVADYEAKPWMAQYCRGLARLMKRRARRWKALRESTTPPGGC